MGLANWLTLGRIMLVPVFVTLLVYNRVQWALGAFVLAGLTDSLDGYIARARGTQTRLGAFLDPLADKLLLTASYVTLTYKFPKILPFWLTATVLSRDLLLIMVALLVMLTGGKVHPAPSQLGKTSTALQMVTVGLALVTAAGVPVGWVLHYVAIPATFALTVASGIQYMLIAPRYVDWD
jgi:cardiolipin synthase